MDLSIQALAAGDADDMDRIQAIRMLRRNKPVDIVLWWLRRKHGW